MCKHVVVIIFWVLPSNVTFHRFRVPTLRRALRVGGMMKIRFPKSETHDKLCSLNIESRYRRPCGRETRLRISGLP